MPPGSVEKPSSPDKSEGDQDKEKQSKNKPGEEAEELNSENLDGMEVVNGDDTGPDHSVVTARDAFSNEVLQALGIDEERDASDKKKEDSESS